MGAPPGTVTIGLRVRWWVTVYLHALIAFCWFTGLEPDPAKVADFIVRYGLKLEIRCA